MDASPIGLLCSIE